MFIVVAPRSSRIFAETGFAGAIITEVLMIRSAGRSPVSFILPTTWSTPRSETSTLCSPSSTPRCRSSSAKRSWSAPRALRPRDLPAGEKTCAPISKVARGPMNRFTSMPAARPIASISVISASVMSMMPLPWLTRCRGTLRLRASSMTASRERGPSVLGISMRYWPPSANRRGDEGAGMGSAAGKLRLASQEAGLVVM